MPFLPLQIKRVVNQQFLLERAALLVGDGVQFLLLLIIKFFKNDIRLADRLLKNIAHHALNHEIMRQREAQRERVAVAQVHAAGFRAIARFAGGDLILSIRQIVGFGKAVLICAELLGHAGRNGLHFDLHVRQRAARNIGHEARHEVNRQPDVAEVFRAGALRQIERDEQRVGVVPNDLHPFVPDFFDFQLDLEFSGNIGTNRAVNAAEAVQRNHRVVDALAVAVRRNAGHDDIVPHAETAGFADKAARHVHAHRLGRLIPLFRHENFIIAIQQILPLIQAVADFFGENVLIVALMSERYDRAGNPVPHQIFHLNRNEVHRQMQALKIHRFGAIRQQKRPAERVNALRPLP